MVLASADRGRLFLRGDNFADGTLGLGPFPAFALFAVFLGGGAIRRKVWVKVLCDERWKVLKK